MKKCGIYIIKNKVNNKVYIGQSVDISLRWTARKNAAKNGAANKLRMLKRGLVFNSQRAASDWANCNYRSISHYKDTKKSAGVVPTTGEPAHWISL